MKPWVFWINVLVIVVIPHRLDAYAVEDAFKRPYHDLLVEVAGQSPLFDSAADVERALLEEPSGDRAVRLKKKIAAARLLLADGQIKGSDRISGPFVTLPVSVIVAAGEKYVLMAQNEGQPAAEPATEPAEQTDECTKSDNRFDIADCDEFNFFDILAFPFRVIGMILELLFNIILFPFKLLVKVVF